MVELHYILAAISDGQLSTAISMIRKLDTKDLTEQVCTCITLAFCCTADAQFEASNYSEASQWYAKCVEYSLSDNENHLSFMGRLALSLFSEKKYREAADIAGQVMASNNIAVTDVASQVVLMGDFAVAISNNDFTKAADVVDCTDINVLPDLPYHMSALLIESHSESIFMFELLEQILGNLRVSGSKLLSWLRAMVDLALAHDNYDAVKSFLTEITKIISTDTEQYNSDDIEYLRGLLWNYSIQFEENEMDTMACYLRNQMHELSKD